MKKRIISRAGSEAQYGPRLAGEILHDYLENSNEPLAVAYRERHEEAEVESGQLFKDLFPNTELGVDLKLFTRKPGRMPVGDSINCMLTRDGDYHYTAVENAIERKVAAARNPHIYRGEFINVVKRGDKMLVPTFCCPRYTKSFTFSDFCRKAAKELLMLTGLVENT